MGTMRESPASPLITALPVLPDREPKLPPDRPLVTMATGTQDPASKPLHLTPSPSRMAKGRERKSQKGEVGRREITEREGGKGGKRERERIGNHGVTAQRLGGKRAARRSKETDTGTQQREK